jgi:hypothetical protein
MSEHQNHPGDIRQLRLGLMCTGTAFETWQTTCIEKLLALDFIKLELVIIDDSCKPASFRSKASRILTHPSRALFRTYTEFAKSPSSKTKSLNSLLAGTSIMHCKPLQDGLPLQYLSDDDCEAISRHNLDIILKFGFGVLQGRILEVPRYGIWAFSDVEEKIRDFVPASFLEVYSGNSVTPGMLIKLEDELNGTILKEGFLRTCSYSYRKNIDRLNRECAEWPARICENIQNNENWSSKGKQKVFKNVDPPGNLHMFLYACRLIKNKMTAAWQAFFFREQWNIGVIPEPIYKLIQPGAENLKTTWAPVPRKGKFLADPFGKPDGKKVTILCEEFNLVRRRGVIASTIFTPGAGFSEDRVVIDSPFHMSYPYLIQYENDIYCIPETFEANGVYLYRAVNFPDKWDRVSAIIPGIPAVDPTLFHYGGLWWMMHTSEDSGPDLNLFVWYSKSLTGVWKPHSRNPIKTDIRSSRPAGTPFFYEGVLFRPAQDCSRTYGGRVAVNRVKVLTPDDFAEDIIAYIEPRKDTIFHDGLHTISSAGDFTIIDGKRFVCSFSKFLQQLKSIV